jgi:hypothetical protein
VEDALVLVGEAGIPERRDPDHPSRFDVRGLPPGTGTVTLRHTAFEGREIPWSAGPGETADLGDVALVRATGTLRGVVRSATAGPVAGVAVRIRAEGVSGAGNDGRSEVTGPDGRFSFEGLPGGAWATAVLLPPRPDELEAGGGRVLRSYRAGPVVVLEPGGTAEVEIPW